MIVCPNCNHQNPSEALQCEACYTPLPSTTNCPNCGATVQTDATFCGQCGFNLKPEVAHTVDDIPETIVSASKASSQEIDEEAIAQTVQSRPTNMSAPSAIEANGQEVEEEADLAERTPALSVGTHANEPLSPLQPEPSLPPLLSEIPVLEDLEEMEPELDSGPLTLPDMPSGPLSAPQSSPQVNSPPPPVIAPQPSIPAASSSATRLQIQTASVLHVQTQTRIELPYSLSVIHIGKPNEQIPPDIDVSGFPDSEIVSRIHADIRVEGDIFYIEDMRSSNGTYINHTPLLPGNRHKLRSGDRISLGKGDRMTFIFQLS